MVSDEIEGRRDHLIAGSHSGELQRDVQGRGAGIRREDSPLADPEVLRDLLLELLGAGTHSEPPAVKRVGYALERVDTRRGNEYGQWRQGHRVLVGQVVSPK